MAKKANQRQEKVDRRKKIEGEWDSQRDTEQHARGLRFSTKIIRLTNGKFGLARQ